MGKEKEEQLYETRLNCLREIFERNSWDEKVLEIIADWGEFIPRWDGFSLIIEDEKSKRKTKVEFDSFRREVKIEGKGKEAEMFIPLGGYIGMGAGVKSKKTLVFQRKFAPTEDWIAVTKDGDISISLKRKS